MNPIQAVSPDDQNVVELSESPGRRLRVLRQSKGWEIERVASQLHLRPHLVEALEQDRFHELPGPVFVMGYLRNYARLLGIDPDPLINAYRAGNPSVEPRVSVLSVSAKSEVRSGHLRGGHLLVRLVSLGLFLTIVGLLVVWWQNRAEGPAEPTLGLEPPEVPLLPRPESLGKYPAVRESESADPLADLGASLEPLDLPSPAAALYSQSPAVPAPTPGTQSSPLEDAEPDLPAGQPPAEATGREASDASPKPPGTSGTPSPEPANPEVVLSFSGTSWVDVRDASGKSVLTGEMRKGDRRVVNGQPPYSFIIGNAKAAAVTVGEKSLDLSTRGRGGVARFQLDPGNAE